MIIEQIIEFELSGTGPGAYLVGGIGPWPPLWVARIVYLA